MAKHKKKAVEVSTKFVPKFWEDIDKRCAIVREVRTRYKELIEHTGADSVQKTMLVQRAVFINIRLETMECEAAQGGRFDEGVYTQMVNTLTGLLNKLGLDRSEADAQMNLKAYVKHGGKS